MRIQDMKKVSAVIFMIGFCAGIIYINAFGKNYITSMGIFSDYFLEEYNGNKINTNEYLWYIIRLRVIPIVLLGIAANTQFRRIVAALFILWTGFAGGVLLTSSILKMGIRGLLLCLIGIIPHFICYIAVYTMIMIYLFTYPGGRWNKIKTVSLILFTLLGIISETYINPVLVDIYIKMI